MAKGNSSLTRVQEHGVTQLSKTLTSLSAFQPQPFSFLLLSPPHHASELEEDADQKGSVGREDPLKKKKRKLLTTASLEHFGQEGRAGLPVQPLSPSLRAALLPECCCPTASLAPHSEKGGPAGTHCGLERGFSLARRTSVPRRGMYTELLGARRWIFALLQYLGGKRCQAMLVTSHLRAQSWKEEGDTGLNKGSTVHCSLREAAAHSHPVFQRTRPNRLAPHTRTPSGTTLHCQHGQKSLHP